MSVAVTTALTAATTVAVPQFLQPSGLKRARLPEPHVSFRRKGKVVLTSQEEVSQGEKEVKSCEHFTHSWAHRSSLCLHSSPYSKPLLFQTRTISPVLLLKNDSKISRTTGA